MIPVSILANKDHKIFHWEVITEDLVARWPGSPCNIFFSAKIKSTVKDYI